MRDNKQTIIFWNGEMSDVARMYRKHGFTLNGAPTMLPHKLVEERFKFLLEEVKEFGEANEAGDFLKMLDALVDVVYVAKGTAVMLGITEWDEHWEEVQRANMDKIRGKSPARQHEQSEDLYKPEGWVAPRHHDLLTNAGFTVPTRLAEPTDSDSG